VLVKLGESLDIPSKGERSLPLRLSDPTEKALPSLAVIGASPPPTVGIDTLSFFRTVDPHVKLEGIPHATEIPGTSSVQGIAIPGSGFG
jgi:hypothetical protein